MSDLNGRYKRLNDVSALVARTIKAGQPAVTELAGEPGSRQTAMLKVAEIKRQLNELNTAFHQLEAILMSHRG